MSLDYCIFDRLIRQGKSFALFRLPRMQAPTLVMQNDLGYSCLDSFSGLNYQKGFVIAPFAIQEHTPLILLRPDVVLHGAQAILNHAAHSQSQKHPLSKTTYVDVKVKDFEAYGQTFERFLQALHTEQYQKLVLSRATTLPQPKNFSTGHFFQKACEIYPTAFIFFHYTPASGAWLGSTPEMLLAKRNNSWETVALAGTMPIKHADDPVEWDEKNQREQNVVTQYIRERLGTYANDIHEKGPYTAVAGAMAHLKTEFRFHLPSKKLIGDLLQSLHPTPAVCGLPKAEAYQFLLQNEGYDRLYYSGFSGYLDPDGQTNLYVNLRCMLATSDHITLFAGGGLLRGSSLMSEWQETEVKMKTMLAVLTS